MELYQNIIDKLHASESLTEEEVNLTHKEDFKKYQQEHQLILQGLKYKALESKLDYLQGVEYQKTASDSKNKWKRFLYILVAAFLLFLSLWFINSKFQTQVDRIDGEKKPLIAEVLKSGILLKYPLIGTERGEENFAAIAYSEYRKSNFSKAIPSFQNLILSDDDIQHRFYLAVSLIATKEYQDAIPILEEDEFLEQNYWPSNYYLGMAYLGLNNNDIAIQNFEKSMDYNVIIKEHAQDVLKLLK